METIIIFLLIIFSLVVIGIVGAWRRIPIMMFIAGALFTFYVVQTDTIIMQYFEDGNTGNIIYQVDGFAGTLNLNNGTTTIRGIGLSTTSVLIGETINCINISLEKNASPTGLVTIGIFNTGTGDTPIKIFGTISAGSLTTSSLFYKFCTTPYTLQTNDVIGAHYEDGDATNRVMVSVDDTNPFDTNNTTEYHFTPPSTWAFTNNWDLRMILSDETMIPATNQAIFELTQWPKIILSMVGALFMLTGVLIWKSREEQEPQ